MVFKRKKRHILRESVTPQNIIDAIKKRYEVKIAYSADEEPKGKGERIIQPVAYGLSTAGNPVIRAFQPYGDTKTKVPHWKMFRLDKITSWKGFPKRKFKEPPGDYTADGKFNPTGDKSMSEVYAIADFEGAKTRYERGGLKKYNDDRMNATPLGKLKRNINKSIKPKNTLDIVKKNIETERPKNTNYWSIYDMAKAAAGNAKDDDVSTISQTVGPIMQGEYDNTQDISTTPTQYDQALKNGPVFQKQDSERKSDYDNWNFSDDEEEIDDTNQLFNYKDDEEI